MTWHSWIGAGIFGRTDLGVVNKRFSWRTGVRTTGGIYFPVSTCIFGKDTNIKGMSDPLSMLRQQKPCLNLTRFWFQLVLATKLVVQRF